MPEHGMETPNVVVENPKIRNAANWVLGVIGIILGTVVAVDGASGAFDLTEVTTPAIVGYAYLAAAFGLAVIRPNIPKG